MTETINERIARCRKLANLTQTEAAEKMGMKCSTYSQMERKGSISTDRLLILAHIFNVSPEILLYGIETKNELDKPLDLQPKNEFRPTLAQNTDLFRESLDSTPFIASHKEENIIKIFRNLPKESKDEIVAFINDKYKESKEK